MIARLSARAERGMAFTFAPRTVLLSMMWAMGKAFPRGDRSPAIEPIAEKNLRARLEAHPSMQSLRVGRTERIDSTFYISQAMELVRP
jgi:magnesium-protoporphyrin O-methyltransferase